MTNNSEHFRQFLHNQNLKVEPKQQPQIKLKNKRKTNIDLGVIEKIVKKVQIEEPNIMEKLQMNPVDLVRESQAYRFGNYKKYYQIRLKHTWDDPRIQVLSEDYFRNKDILDIGCNDGTITLLIAMKFFPKSIRGIDIDYQLINKAIENMVELEKKQNRYSRNEFKPIVVDQDLEEKIKQLPICFSQKLEAKNIIQPQFQQTQQETNTFPKNTYFRVENIIGNKQHLEKYDTVLCLSLTKWIHLNFGDAGIHKLFKRISEITNPGGILILEPQDWKSYKKKKYFCKEFKHNYQSIQLKPNDFASALCCQYGFQLIKTIKPDDEEAIKQANSTFRRMIQILQKINN